MPTLLGKRLKAIYIFRSKSNFSYTYLLLRGMWSYICIDQYYNNSLQVDFTIKFISLKKSRKEDVCDVFGCACRYKNYHLELK